jgi:hypothetical protein
MIGRRAKSLFVLVFALSGCAALTGPDWRAISQQSEQIRAGCESQFGAGIIKTHLATEQCSSAPIRDLYASNGWPDMDVLDAYLAHREAIAEQWDRRAISDQQARAQLAQAVADQNTQLQYRAANRAMGAAAARASMPVFCTRNGPTIICQ